MDKLIYSLMDAPLDVPGIKFCDSFMKSDAQKIQIDKTNRYTDQVIEQAKYSAENERVNNEVGRIVASWLRKKKGLNIVQREPDNPNYPKFMLLGTDRGILAYIEFFYHASAEEVSDDVVGSIGICHIMSDLKERLPLVDSDLDRPVFYVHVVNNKNQKGIFFETAEMIKNNIFEKTKSVYEDDPVALYFSDISEMGDFAELTGMFEDLKKNNVKFY